MKYQDCLYRYMDTFEYGVFLDHDDFLNPVIPGHTDIHYYFDVLFRDSRTGSIYFSWRDMQCGPHLELVRTLADGNLTSILTGNKMSWRNVAKCGHRLNAVDYVSIHEVQTLVPGYTKRSVNKTKLYVAHNRQTTNIRM